MKCRNRLGTPSAPRPPADHAGPPRARPLAILAAIALLAFPLFASAQRCADPGAHDACERTRPGFVQAIDLPDKAALSPVSRKIAVALRQASAAIRAYSPAARTAVALSALSTDAVRVDAAGEVQVYVILREYRPEYVAQLEALGLRTELALPEFRVVQGWIAADLLELVAANDFVVEVTPPGYPVPKVGAQLTAGDSIMKAASARATFGVTGAGVTVGVISDGVDHLAQSVATADLPAGVAVLKNPGGDEGTAMLEIVHDLAPGAALAYYGPTTSADMVAGINALANAGARVVVDDLTFFDEPKFQDGMIAQTARNFATGGKVYVTSAGNEALRHYRAPYNRLAGQNFPGSDYPAVHNYVASPGSDIGNTFALPNGCTIRVVLQWNNPNGASADDLDLFLGSTGTLAVLASSIGSQSGAQNAYEFLSYTNTSGATMTVFIAVAEWSLASAPSSLVLDYFIYEGCGIDSGTGFEYVTSADSVIGHAAVNEVLSVAALPANAPSTIETFSSRGPGSISFPAPETRSVPNISGIDCVATQVGASGFFFNPFCGTSAAAPHVAAVAALLAEANPTLTSAQLRDRITAHAVDLGPPGYDLTFGYGRADASASVSAVLDTWYPYTVAVTNNGPSEVTGALVTNPAPAGLVIGAWTCAVTSPGSGGIVTTACGAASGTGPLNTTANLKVGGTVTYTISARVTASGGSVTDTVSVKPPAGVTNPGTSCTTMVGSNARSFDAATGTCSASDTDVVIP